jgi:hypothetical protein
MGADVATMLRLYWPCLGAALAVGAMVIVRKSSVLGAPEILGEFQINLGLVTLPRQSRNQESKAGAAAGVIVR